MLSHWHSISLMLFRAFKTGRRAQGHLASASLRPRPATSPHLPEAARARTRGPPVSMSPGEVYMYSLLLIHLIIL